MAMLAAPRRKQKVINLRAKNVAWSDDSEKKGRRMMELMGWQGKGLGPEEKGNVEPVVARYKNDDRGLGFEDRNDQWTKHEDDFNSLLANLSSGENNDKKLHSGISLEDKSKKSKKRVHYHKFTRGKDLTRYSDKDLANIFGKKSLKNEIREETEEPVETNTGIVFSEKGSMEDYFKSKLAAIKSKTKLNKTSHDDSADYFKRVNNDKMEEDYEYEESYLHRLGNDKVEEESHRGFGFPSLRFNTEDNDRENENVVSVSEEIFIEPPKKKKKKQKPLGEEITQEIEDSTQNLYTHIGEPEINKKSKKKKQKKHLKESVEEPVEPVDYVPKKNKKKTCK